MENELKRIIEPVVKGEGFILKDISFDGKRLTITIDKEDGVTASDCGNISKKLEPVLDKRSSFSNYLLVVSSPGIG